MDFRPAKEDELGAVLALYRSVIGGEYCTWNEFYPTMEDINYDFENAGLYVLTAEEEVLGAVSFAAENELDELPFWQCREAVAELARVVIRPDMQGRGLSGWLVTKAEELLRTQGIKAVHLLAAVKNTPACRCYASCGYVHYEPLEMYENLFYPCEKLL